MNLGGGTIQPLTQDKIIIFSLLFLGAMKALIF